MLPYFEEQNLFDLYDFTVNWDRPTAGAKGIPNAQLVAKRLTVFECPSVPDEGRLDGDYQYWTQGYTDWNSSRVAAPTDYSPIVQVEARVYSQVLTTTPPPEDLTGMMLRNSVCTLRQVSDGTSNTIMLAESAGRPYVYRLGNKIGDLTGNRVNGGGWCRPASDYGLDGSSVDGVSCPGPCAINCMNGEDYLKGGTDDKGIVPDPIYGTFSTSETYAFHSGGANVVFGDGSVHFLAEQIEMRVMAQLVTRRGNETVSETFD